MTYSRCVGILLFVIDDTRRVWSVVGVQGGVSSSTGGLSKASQMGWDWSVEEMGG